MSSQPLAYRMAPTSLDDYVGQQHLLGKGKLLRRMLEADRLSSMILFGPPGTGKTSLARVIAETSQLPFRRLNAVTAGVGDIKRMVEEARNPFMTPQGKLILFIDEIHRFNKLQQDALLPSVEAGTVILIGATTENPFFEVNKALISRTTVFQLQPLSEDEIREILQRAIQSEKGLGKEAVRLEEKAATFLANRSNGDARIALNALELAALTTSPNRRGEIVISLEVAADCIQKRSTAFDASGEGHYDTISALIKSMRGSDPDASLYYLALALHGGEDIEFLARRMIILAAEDVGMANPTALMLATAAYQAAVTVGMPEARIPLAEAAVFLATSPKSNASYKGINEALAMVQEERVGPIPFHLRNAPVAAMKDLGYGEGYRYAHDFEDSYVVQQYLPDGLEGHVFYRPTKNGYEGSRVRPLMEERRQRREKERAREGEKHG